MATACGQLIRSIIVTRRLKRGTTPKRTVEAAEGAHVFSCEGSARLAQASTPAYQLKSATTGK
jgi:hypothetical protein